MAAASVGIIRDGDNAILDINGDFKAFVTVSSKGCAGLPCSLHFLTPADRLPCPGNIGRIGLNRHSMTQYCVLQRHQGAFVLERRKVKVGKTFCSLAPLIGHSYGVQFEIPADGEAIEVTTKKARHSHDLPPPWCTLVRRLHACVKSSHPGTYAPLP